MKKHIIGLALFSFIVITAAVVYAIFSVPEIIPVSAPKYVPAERTHCNMRRKIKESKFSRVEVTQAIINLQTKEFSWEVAAPETDAPINLHFFTKENGGTSYLTSLPFVTLSHTGQVKINKAFKFLYDRKSYENLYVIGEYYYESEIYNEANPPRFDINRATAVTFNYGEDN